MSSNVRTIFPSHFPHQQPIALALTTLLLSTPVLAADLQQSTDAEARYQAERAACANKPAGDERDNCLREAAAARNAARQGELDDASSAYTRNALARCEGLPVADRDACHRRVREEGATSGSVSSGGILREYREIILTPPPPANAAEGSQAQDRK